MFLQGVHQILCFLKILKYILGSGPVSVCTWWSVRGISFVSLCVYAGLPAITARCQVDPQQNWQNSENNNFLWQNTKINEHHIEFSRMKGKNCRTSYPKEIFLLKPHAMGL